MEDDSTDVNVGGVTRTPRPSYNNPADGECVWARDDGVQHDYEAEFFQPTWD